MTIAESVIAEDPRVVAVVLANELQHALDRQRVVLDLLDPDCVTMEVRGFEAQARVTRLFWPGELPNGTVLERNVALVVRDYDEHGAAGIAARIAGDARYREACAARAPDAGRTVQSRLAGMSETDAIVRDLAGLSPVVDSDVGDYCAMCGKVGGADVDLTVPGSHEQRCVWRRASELFPGPPD